jgi:hypothetical protein
MSYRRAAADSHIETRAPDARHARLHQVLQIGRAACDLRRAQHNLYLPIATIGASPCPAPNLVTYDVDDNERLWLHQFDFSSSNFYLWDDDDVSPTAGNEFYTKFRRFSDPNQNKSFRLVTMPQNTRLFHWRSAVFQYRISGRIDYKNLTSLPEPGQRLYTNDVLYTNTAEDWLYHPNFEDFYAFPTMPMAVLMQITVTHPTQALKDDYPVQMNECEKHDGFLSSETVYHSDLVLPPSTFTVKNVCYINTNNEGNCKLPNAVHQRLIEQRDTMLEVERNNHQSGINGMWVAVIDLEHTGVITNWEDDSGVLAFETHFLDSASLQSGLLEGFYVP